MSIKLREAFGRKEGYGKPGTRATRNNNPGNIEFAPWTRKEPFNAVLEKKSADGTQRFACFPTPSQGELALDYLLSTHYGGHTLRDTVFTFAPPSENDSEKYLSDVCEWTGYSPTDLICNILLKEAA